MTMYLIRDPFAGDLTIEGESLKEALEHAYQDIPPSERPEHVWMTEDNEFGTYHRRVHVPGGLAKPLY